ncbi:hypothetical protein F5Y16DRAFT_383431 [Xylariaceae sp. FL0255]|nr:hypothetical protein F5Y16DRAFT_383431 [Xylariaceae sp. FL0255]
MGRRKIEIKAIKDDRNRSVTFLKRKGGLFKKAHELSVLCSVDVAVFIFGNNKKLYEYSSSDMRDLIGRYTYHGIPNEHKGPADYNGGGDDDDDEDGDGTPPHVHEGSVEPQLIPPHYGGQPAFPHLRHHTPSASPPINGMPFVPRGHTPQPQMGSRPSSRNDFRRPPSVPHPGGPPGPQPVANGYAYMPQPAIYNPQAQPQIQHGLPPPPPPPPPAPYQYAAAHPPQMPPYVEEPRHSSVPPPTSFPPAPARPQPSPPQVHVQQLPPQAAPHMTPPQPSQHLEVPGQRPPPPRPQPGPEPPVHATTQMEPPKVERPGQPGLDSSSIRKLPQRNQAGSIFTPIEDNRSVLGQHLDAFHAEPLGSDEAGSRSQSVDIGAASRNKASKSPPVPQRASISVNIPRARNSISNVSDGSFAAPSRSNSMKIDGASRPRLRVQIPDEASDAGSNTGEPVTTTSPRGTADASAQPARRAGDAPPVVLPPPSPSATTLLSAGATGPPNPFARPPPQNHSTGMNIDTPVSALPSRFLNNEFLPSPSSFYPDWNFRGDNSNTLPSPLNFATPVAGTGPSFLRDDIGTATTKRKSPDMGIVGPNSDGPEGFDHKRIKVDS